MSNKFKLWALNHEEKSFINKQITCKPNELDSLSIIQCPQDLFYLKRFKEVIKNDLNHKYLGILPKTSNAKFVVWVFPYPLKLLHDFMIKKKWKKLYSSIGIFLFIYPNKKFATVIKNIVSAFKLFRNLKNKKDLLNHKFQNILCGDLIYDSYLRFNKKPTLNVYDPTLILFIIDCYNQICFYQNFISKHKIQNYYSSYSSYVTHGIPVRVFLKHGVNVYTLSTAYLNQNQFKKLSLEDFSHVNKHWEYRNIFKSLKNKEIIIKESLKSLNGRFNGLNDLNYMDVDPYKTTKNKMKFDFTMDGMIFLHDFFDSPHIYRRMVFVDFYEWIEHSIKLILKNNLNIGIKPHPNQRPESRKIVNKLKSKYPTIIFIDEKISNKSIFDSGIRFGVSVHGSVLSELAYHNIKPISCGDNPASSFDYIYEAKSKNEYDNFILNHENLPLKKNIKKRIGEFYYMNHVYKYSSSL